MLEAVEIQISAGTGTFSFEPNPDLSDQFHGQLASVPADGYNWLPGDVITFVEGTGCITGEAHYWVDLTCTLGLYPARTNIRFRDDMAEKSIDNAFKYCYGLTKGSITATAVVADPDRCWGYYYVSDEDEDHLYVKCKRKNNDCTGKVVGTNDDYAYDWYQLCAPGFESGYAPNHEICDHCDSGAPNDALCYCDSTQKWT